MKIRILNEDCDPSLASDLSLPTNSFLVQYTEDDTSKFDIVMSNKKVDIFDHYWDKYKSNLNNITQTEGKKNPKLYNPNPKKEK